MRSGFWLVTVNSWQISVSFLSFVQLCRFGFPAETLPNFPQVLAICFLGASLLSSCCDGILIRELIVQYREAGWHQLPILEGAGLQCAGAKEAGQAHKAKGCQTRRHNRFWLAGAGWTCQVYYNADFVKERVLQRQGHDDQFWAMGEVMRFVREKECSISGVLAEATCWS